LDEKFADVIVNRFYHNFPDKPIKRNGVLVDPASLFGESR